jgi:hypothetical protein
MGAATNTVVAGTAEMTAAVNAFGETAAQQAARIRDMVAASKLQAAANAEVSESQRSLAERAGKATTATVAQTAAIRAQIAAQEAQMVPIAAFVGAEQNAAAGAAALAGAAAGTNTALGQTAVISGGVARELGVLTGEAMRGNFTRMEGSAITLANRMGLMQKVFSSTGLTIAGFAAAGALVVDWMVHGAMEASALNKEIIATGNFAGVTASSVELMSRAMVGGATSLTTAKDAMTQLIASGKFSSDEIAKVGQATVDMSAVTGKSIKEVVADFEEIQKSPVDATIKLNNQYHFLTEAILDQIEALHREGDDIDAAKVAMDALGAVMHTRAQQILDDAGYVEQAIQRWSRGFANIKGFVFDWGKPATDLDKFDSALTNYQRDLLAYQREIAVAGDQNSTMFVQWRAKLQQEFTAVTALKQAYQDKNKAAADQGAAQQQLAITLQDAAAFDKLAQSLAKQGASYLSTHLAAVQFQIDQRVAAESAGLTATQIDVLRDRITKQAQASIDNAMVLDGEKKAHQDAAAAARDQAAALAFAEQQARMSAKGMQELQTINDSFAGKVGDDYAKAWATYEGEVSKVVDAYNKAVVVTKDIDQAETLMAQAMASASEQYHRRLDVLNALHSVEMQSGDAVQQLINKYKEEDSDLGVNAGAHQLEIEKLAAEKQMREAVIAAVKAGHPEYAAQLDDLMKEADAHVENTARIKENEAVMKMWQGVATSAFDSVFNTLNKDIVEGGNVMKDLENVAKQVVESILFTFEKLAIINPLLNQIFGLSGSSLLPTLFNTAGGAAAGGGGPNLLAMLGGGANAGSSWLGSLFGGGSGAFAGSAAGATGSAGAAAFNGSSAGAAGGIQIGGVGLGTIVGVAGGILAGYNEFKAAGGGAGGVAGGIAYGVGTYALAGAGAAALSGGLAAGLAAIPVVGWIALAAMALNAITGGGLFGTAAKPIGSETNVNIGQGGASITQAIDEKGKKALFGGSYWKTVDVKVDQKTQDAIAAFFSGVSQAAVAEATAFGVDTATIVTGSFHETFDKAGKMLTQTSTVLGQKYTESIQDFQTRIMADTLLANMGDASAEAQAIAQQWQSTANDLMAGAQFLAQAELDIHQGHALAADDTLTQLTKFVQGMEAQGETLIQTYVRLSQETSTVETTLARLGLSTGKTGEALVKFDDDMVKAAGSLQNLTSLWNTYFSEYYTQAEQQAMAQKDVTGMLTSLGLDPSISESDFRKAFEAALPTLTPAQVVQWLAAGAALHSFDQAMQQTTDAANKAAQDGATAFQSFMDKIVQGVQQAEQEAGQIAAKLFGTPIDQLKAKLADAQGHAAAGGPAETYWLNQAAALQKQIDSATAQQTAAQRLGDATTLLKDLSVIGEFAGGSLADLAAKYGFTTQQLATELGVSNDQLQGMFDQQEKAARAQIDLVASAKATNELLADIFATLNGQTAPYSAGDIYADNNAGSSSRSVGRGKGGSPIHIGGGPVSDSTDVVTAVKSGATQQSSDTQALLKATLEQNDLLRQMLQRFGGGPGVGPRTGLGRVPAYSP